MRVKMKKGHKENNNRTPGPDNICGELFKKGGKELLNRMHAVMMNVSRRNAKGLGGRNYLSYL
jgi:hypothetical protein